MKGSRGEDECRFTRGDDDSSRIETPKGLRRVAEEG
jgi:hypothetical protein